jgi:hypothetical protein
VQAEKKARAVRVEEVEADEQMEEVEEMEETEHTSRSDGQKKKRKEKKKRDRERRKQKRESARLLNPPPQPPPRRDENSPNKRVHFFAEFSQYGWCRNMKIDEENAPVNFGIRLCDSKKKNTRSDFRKQLRESGTNTSSVQSENERTFHRRGHQSAESI